MDDLRLFYTLADAGYTECRHPRTQVNRDGDLGRPLVWCKDCGATGSDFKGGSMTFYREPVFAT